MIATKRGIQRKNLIKRIKKGHVKRDEGMKRLAELWQVRQKRIKK